jgi:hypothetical protein
VSFKFENTNKWYMCFMGCNNDGWKKFLWSSLETKNEKNFVEMFCKKWENLGGYVGKMKFLILKNSNKKRHWDGGYEVHGSNLI